MDDSSNPYSATGGPPQSVVETASITPIESQNGTAVTVSAANPVTDNPIVGQPSQRILGRHIVSSQSRGVQTMAGEQIVNNPNTGNPVVAISALKQNIIYSDPTTQTPRIIAGLLPDNSYGMWVSKPGVDATTASSTDLIFNSNQDIFKIVQTDTVSVDFISSPFSVFTLAHGLDFAPIPVAFLTDVTDGTASGNFPFPTNLSVTVDLTDGFIKVGASLNVAADATNVYFECVNALGIDLGTFDIKYYLLQESSS